jgi:predicted site-specific integrase-resolvase|tara:strand:- start:534 stop:845 length:312 start_codon:yes stop_codon:yes gene_type:complete
MDKDKPDLSILNFEDKKKDKERTPLLDRKVKRIIVSRKEGDDVYEEPKTFCIWPLEGLFQVVVNDNDFVTYPTRQIEKFLVQTEEETTEDNVPQTPPQSPSQD